MTNPRNWILASPELGDDATITASGSATGSPVANVQKIQPTDAWVSTTATPYMELDLGVVNAHWNFIGILFNNGDSRNSFRVRAASTQGGLTGTTVYDSGFGSLRCSTAQSAAQTNAAYGFVAPPYFFELRVRIKSLSDGILATRKNTGSAARLSFTVGVGGTIAVANSTLDILCTSPSLAPTKTWIHLGVLVETTAAHLYVDGVRVASDTHSSSALVYDQIAINQTESGPLPGINADYDWVRLWLGTRTEEEILANAHVEAVGTEAGLVANYKLNNSAANTGSVGGSLTLTGAPGYAYAERAWASNGLENLTRRHGMLWYPTGVTARWLRIDYDWEDNADAVAKVGRLYVADAHQFARNPQYGAEIMVLADNARTEQMAGGQTIVTPSGVAAGCRLPFEFDSYSELAAFMDVARVRGASRDVVAVLDPIDHDGHRHDRIFYGLLSQRIVANVPAYSTYRSQVEISGLI